jgi:DNA-binding IscR family transcriptional regulator
VRLSARADYAVRAAIELATRDGYVRADELAEAQAIPHSFLSNILVGLRRAGIVRGVRPDVLEYVGSAAPLREVWIALRASVRDVLEHVTLADLAAGELPDRIHRLTADSDAWRAH